MLMRVCIALLIDCYGSIAVILNRVLAAHPAKREIFPFLSRHRATDDRRFPAGEPTPKKSFPICSFYVPSLSMDDSFFARFGYDPVRVGAFLHPRPAGTLLRLSDPAEQQEPVSPPLEEADPSQDGGGAPSAEQTARSPAADPSSSSSAS